MPYEFSAEGRRVLESAQRFMDQHIYPSEGRYYEELEEVGPFGHPPVVDELKAKAAAEGLWNLFLPELEPGQPGTRLSNVDYAPISEQLGKVWFASEVFNCQPPDSGNIEILNQYATPAVKGRWLGPLLSGEIRSAYSMSEPDAASSDATNIDLRITRDGDHYVLDGRKWFSSGAKAQRCKLLVVMGRSNPDAPRHRQHSMLAVPLDTPGIEFGALPTVFGYQERGGHPEVIFREVRVPVDNLLGEEGGGFAIAQARLGPGRIHHCMRAIGVAERALELMITRSLRRRTFGSTLAHKGTIQQWIAESRINIDMARQYVLHAAHLMDTVGNKEAATEIGGIKVAIPEICFEVVDRAVQVHGAAGVTQFTPLAYMYAKMRTLRLADGPDEVHKMSIARREIRKHDPNFRLSGPSRG
ncbi:acyl-CoA dehydrogenase family protein [Prauserella flavalba]|uniref:Acyl-CoA dehydrogenase n=1 Tax=Prauserella flavalba TaxID=1477506 RepID=A0A318LGZ6_9PSEU|nr:acyl-CoA dehydrogenase family protein [Prauserella flavalba]PXY18426.1 acyl-CoA dehydrogenase [Prauserella flavalba]